MDTVNQLPVFAFNDSSSYDASDVDFTVGTDDMRDSSITKSGPFSANDENDYDPQEESYRNSVSDIIRSIIGNCVPHDYTRYDLSRFLKDQTAPSSPYLHYKHEGKFVNPKKIYHPTNQTWAPLHRQKITVKHSYRGKVRLKLTDDPALRIMPCLRR